MLFYGKCIDLTFRPDNQRNWLDFIEKNNGKNVVVEIELEKSKRSLDQNALYWLFLNAIEKETGNDARTMHELFKRKFLPPIHKELFGVSFKIPSSTTELSKVEFGEYLDKISAFTEVPIPQEVKEFKIEVAYPKNELGEAKF